MWVETPIIIYYFIESRHRGKLESGARNVVDPRFN